MSVFLYNIFIYSRYKGVLFFMENIRPNLPTTDNNCGLKTCYICHDSVPESRINRRHIEVSTSRGVKDLGSICICNKCFSKRIIEEYFKRIYRDATVREVRIKQK